MATSRGFCDYGADERVPAAQGGMKADAESCDYGADENKLASRVGEKTVCNNDRCQFCDYGADESELATWIAPRRARGVWFRVITDVRPYPMLLLARIDGLLGTFKEFMQLGSTC